MKVHRHLLGNWLFGQLGQQGITQASHAPEIPQQQEWHAEQMKWRGREFGPKHFKRIKQVEKAENAREKKTQKNPKNRLAGISRKKDERDWS